MAHRLEDRVRQRVVHERLVVVRIVQHPVRVGRQAEQLVFHVVTVLVVQLDVELLLRKARRGLAADF